ncbi:hypothetical protein M758_4G021700 [Ceratodon purpureus]|nr:hypothetical protein M758_4G021700 [Ceratodon purpureus]
MLLELWSGTGLCTTFDNDLDNFLTPHPMSKVYHIRSVLEFTVNLCILANLHSVYGMLATYSQHSVHFQFSPQMLLTCRIYHLHYMVVFWRGRLDNVFTSSMNLLNIHLVFVLISNLEELLSKSCRLPLCQCWCTKYLESGCC